MKTEQEEWETVDAIASRAAAKIMEKQRARNLLDITAYEIIREAIEAYKKAPEGGWSDERACSLKEVEQPAREDVGSTPTMHDIPKRPNASPTYARKTTVPAFPIMVEDRTKTIGYWHINDANGVLLADVYSDEMARNIHYCFNHSEAEYALSLMATIKDLKEVIRLMVYPSLTERLKLAETHAGPFSLIEAKLENPTGKQVMDAIINAPYESETNKTPQWMANIARECAKEVMYWQQHRGLIEDKAYRIILNAMLRSHPNSGCGAGSSVTYAKPPSTKTKD